MCGDVVNGQVAVRSAFQQQPNVGGAVIVGYVSAVLARAN